MPCSIGSLPGNPFLIGGRMSERPESADRDFGRLLMEYRGRIYSFIRSLVVHRADAEDLLQETASVLWRKFDEFQPGSRFDHWAYHICRLQALCYLKERRRSKLVQDIGVLIDQIHTRASTELAPIATAHLDAFAEGRCSP